MDEIVSSPSLDEVFDLLANRRRRYVLYYLRETSSGVTEVEPLVDRVIEWLGEIGRDEPDEEARREILAAIHHVDLPKLEAANVVDYDWRSRTIRYRSFDVLEKQLALLEERELS